MFLLIFSIANITVGIILILMAVTVDLFFNGTPGYGWKQMVCFVGGPLCFMTGVRILTLKRQKLFDYILLGTFLSGILFIGLKSEEYGLDYSYELLSIYNFSTFDFIVNILGFIPIGYLLMSIAEEYNHSQNTKIIVTIGIGFLIGFVIEAVQLVCIKSRVASIYDLFGNCIGTTIGAFMLVELVPLEKRAKMNLSLHLKNIKKLKNRK